MMWEHRRNRYPRGIGVLGGGPKGPTIRSAAFGARKQRTIASTHARIRRAMWAHTMNPKRPLPPATWTPDVALRGGGEIVCPASVESKVIRDVTCGDCKLCRGDLRGRGKPARSITIVAHGRDARFVFQEPLGFGVRPRGRKALTRQGVTA